MTPFVHLRVHTEYSLVDSVVRVPELIAATAAANMPAVALTDEHNLFAMVKFYREALRNGVKPLIGVDLTLAEPGERSQPSRLTLLCMNPLGYGNLTRLVSRAYLEGQQKGTPTIDRSWLTPEITQGLIALSGGASGDLGRALQSQRPGEAERALSFWQERFGADRYYLELTRVGRSGEDALIDATLTFAERHGLPVVATNDVRFLAPGDFEAHEARVCIHDGALLADPSRPRKYTPQQYLRSPAEMAELFADIPEALTNSVEIARRCSLPLRLGESMLPHYPVPEGQTTEEFLRQEAEAGLAQRLAALPQADPQHYRDRLEIEIGVICPMGFAGYFLIVADFIRWARENGVPVGPGRGSGAGSLVAYALGITDIDPLEHDLLFERFLNPERVSMPDFDVDFCMEGRDRVIEYVAEKYGRERVSQIITYGTMAAKAVVRDAGRVLGLSYGYVDKIAKLVPFELDITLAAALEKEPELARLYKEDDEVRNLIDLARSLEGLTRNAGKHAGGVVIAPSVLTDFAPLYCEAGGESVVTQFDKDDVEAAGLVKFDFLGLRTLTIIDRAVHTIDAERAAAGQPPFDLNALPMDDPATYALLKSCHTTAVFQLESRGMKDLIRRLQPDCFEDIVALVALFRPGPLQSGMVDDFIDRKHGRSTQPIDYLHPSLEPVLKPTYGVILYQEQVMQIAQVLAGYTLGGADLLRRAMGKKKPEEMAKQRSVFVEGATERGVPQQQAAHIFDLMEKFAGYGFNKSHSAAYALLSFQTAYLKAHHPAAFMAAVLSADMDHTDKVVTLKDECDRMGLQVLAPDLNASGYAFEVADPNTVRYGLGAIRGVGQGVVEAIVAERTSGGPFTGLEDVCRRIDLNKLNRRVLEAMIRSGSCDGFGLNRATLMARLPAAMQLGEQATRAVEAGQVDLFGLSAAPSAPSAAAAPGIAGPAAGFQPEWSEAIRLAGERETLGLYLTGHPINRYERDLGRFVSGRIADLISDRPPPPSGNGDRPWTPGKPATVAGYIHELRKRGSRISAILDDRTGRIEVTFFDEVFQQHRDLIVKDALVVIEGSLRFDEFSDGWRLAARRVVELDRLREQQAQRLVITWPRQADPEALLGRLGELLAAARPGSCVVAVRYAGEKASAALELGPDWRIRASRALLEQLEGLVGSDGLRVFYGPPAGSVSTAAG
ncbi:MAG: DNA polymerase III subunit alpha [Steroidobacteraceae bacterium]|nr:DNA polymerase III subunit alpha [Nevskiaceae bacterium]MCP5360614.1 DNA polymerase III subunit alpha [Nevskiaceae bacterium]MCP5467228.1 DNA polymerase III subunit alpha [Nevskiaceae bacterium]